jgi:membrane protein DedA with SNARE-associated domain
MWSWINAAVDLVSLYPAGAMAAVFLAAIIEAVAVLGILIPGTPILMAVAGAAAMAGQPMVPLLVLSIIGAVIGDFVSFWFGGRFSGRLCKVWPFSGRPALMANAAHFFEHYGTYSVALCRFVPVLRSTVPLVAGMAGMCRRRFVLANVTSAFVWAPLHIYPAKMAGMSLSRLADGHWQSAAVWGVILLVCCAIGWAIHRVIMTRVRPSAASHALCVDVQRIQAVAGCHEQAVAEAAAEAQIGAAFRQGDVADR